VRDAKDFEAFGRQLRERNLPAGEGPGLGSHDVIIQEGVLTQERVHDSVAEPVIYMMDRYVVGGFYRVHAGRSTDETLNLPGASFVPLAFSDSAHLPQHGAKPGASAPNRFYMYGVIGRLAMVAASYEMEATDPDAEVYE
jgi:glutamate--cysteine ligase